MSCQEKNNTNQQEAKIRDNMKKIKHKIVVMSGKGGVGKSTLSTNIAYGLSLQGKKVGLLDADLHGPNIPLMLGIEGVRIQNSNKPYELNSNLKVVSLSFFMESSDNPIIWRGPAKIGAIRELLGEIEWGELDYLVVDLPPGTGDEPLTIAQDIGKVDGSVIVTTPQDVAILDSRKSVKFSKMVNMPVLGIVENMSGFVCPHCGDRIDIFKVGGGEKAAKELEVPMLGKIPMTPEMVEAGDSGRPHIFSSKNDCLAAKELKNIVNKIIKKVEGEEMNTNKSEILRIAFPTNDKENVESHFGHCKQFAIFTVNGQKIGKTEYVDAPPHQPGLLPKFLGELDITTIITGGMGQRAVDLFKAQNVDVILGAGGSIQENLAVFLKGNLASTGSVCNHDHDENHSCDH
ncbi:iron-sulfur cluster carrier protein MrpORP [uncultured Ilyobacter sp.]|uniref:iron-sulfur cluster carrier protein MrpORP n=1 Tax=uncultured Ilyobacter sp. TaxID=544433 RepID=UPI0029C8C5CC|nr:iron-sulfur cluster carrier protein MrpORP [uncultured Ilyobacter sp.]